jgi:iron(III) transport system substrate-binding protein
MKRLLALLSVLAGVVAPAVSAQEQVLNLYSARHYQTDEALYQNFTKQTGIRINRIEAGDDQLIERLKSEGANSPADVLLIVDAARLAQADDLGLFQPVKSRVLEERIPAELRDPQGEWFGLSSRARVIVYNKATIDPRDVATYASLAEPRNKGKVCTRSGSHVYNLSLMSALIEHWGEARAEEWARGVVANFARAPKGGDTDQIKGVATGECGVAIANTYYYARLLGSDKPADRKLMDSVALVWPNQKSFGTHLNVSGAGVLKNAPHKDAAIRYLEYLASDSAQTYFASGNNEWPAVTAAPLNNRTLEAMGKFKADSINVGALGKNQPAAQKIFDRVGYK